ncbi:MAG: hypothetical protein REI11_21460 [Patulibacter sp.]|nr:hypothetical protein [Patulibacter sp.]
MSAPESISPRGVPPIRPDWLVDAAWRLADLGLNALRAAPEDTYYELTDTVDGDRWRFRSEPLGRTWSTSVEHDADLFIPTDTAAATLRAGFQFTPWWEDGRRCVQVRVEIGPRGPVTFDPENWFVVLPLPGAERPDLAGVTRGAWSVLDSPGSAPAPAHVDALVGHTLGLGDLSVLKPGASVPELLLHAAELRAKGGVFGRRKLVPAWDEGLLARIEADGPLDLNWTGAQSLPEAIERGTLTIESVEPGDGQITFRGDGDALTVTGTSLRVSAARLA